MKIDVLHSEGKSADLDLPSIWEDLSKEHFPHLCNSYHWQKAAKNSYYPSVKPTYLVCREKNETVGLIPLLRTRDQFARLPINRYHFFEQSVNLCSLMLRKEYISTVLSAILAHKSKLLEDAALLKVTTRGSHQSAAINTFVRANRKHVSALKLPKTVQLTEARNRTEFLQEVLSKKHRKKHNACLKRGFNDQEISIERIAIGEKVSDISTHWQRFLSIYQQSWKHDSARSITRNMADASFFEQIFSTFAKSGNLHCTLLKEAEKDIAISWSVNYQDQAFGLQTAYRSDYQQFSPGKILMVEHLADYFNHGSTFDLMGSHPYKNSLSNKKMEYCDYYLFRNTIYSAILRQLAKLSPLPFQSV